jgi:hypothetical protein
VIYESKKVGILFRIQCTVRFGGLTFAIVLGLTPFFHTYLLEVVLNTESDAWSPAPVTTPRKLSSQAW